MAHEPMLPEPISAERAVRQQGHDVRVPDSQSRTIGPSDEETNELFRVVAIRTFDDLRLLGFVHPQLDQPGVLAAIRADNQQHRALIGSISHRMSDGCGCGGGCGAHDGPRIQRAHSNLINVLQPLVNDELWPLHPAVLHTRSYISRFVAGTFKYIGMFTLNDITVGDNATLTMSPSVSLLHANDITIGKQGRLRFAGSGVKVKCRTLNGPTNFDQVINAPIGWTKEYLKQGEHS